MLGGSVKCLVPEMVDKRLREKLKSKNAVRAAKKR